MSKPKFIPLSTEEIVTKEIVQDIITNGVGENCELIDFEAKLGTKLGENYCSLIYSVKINFRQVAEMSPQTLSIYFKTIPRNPFRVKMLKEFQSFEKEVKTYKYILPGIRSVGKEFIINSLPKCFHSFSDGMTDYIALEDLRSQGFKMLNRYAWLDLEHAKFAIEELAKFHAISYSKWKGDGETLLSTFPFLAESVWHSPEKVSETWKYMAPNSFLELAKLLREHGFEAEATKIDYLKNGIFERMHDALTISKKFPSVIVHCDAWSNNFMFRYDEFGRIDCMKILDFQCVRVGSRVLDLSYLLFTSLHIQILNNNFNELVKFYFDRFQYFNSILGGPTNFGGLELSFEYFLEEWEHYKHAGLKMALINTPAMCARPEDIPDFEAVDFEDISSEECDGKFSNFLKSEETVKRVANISRRYLL